MAPFPRRNLGPCSRKQAQNQCASEDLGFEDGQGAARYKSKVDIIVRARERSIEVLTG